MDLKAELLSAGSAGILFHNVALSMESGISSFAAIAVFKAAYHGLPVASALAASGGICTTYLASLFASIITYRTMFHRLRHFPGPALAKVSKLWHVAHCLDSKNDLLLEGLHQEYGDFVRTGPNELTIFAPDVLLTTHGGPSNPFGKPAWYDILQPYIGLTNHRDRKVHEYHRRVWDHGFTTRALQSYQVHIKAYARQLERVIAEHGPKPITANEYFCWFSFDVMGQFAYSKSFNNLRDRKLHEALRMIRVGMGLTGPFTPVPWLIRIAFENPIATMARDLHKLLRWCSEQMDERIEISHYLIQASAQQGTLQQDRTFLYGDAIGMIVAGSDTTASTLVSLFYRLVQHPEHMQKVQKELDTAGDVEDLTILQKLPHLNGIINETLRLHPAVPTGGLRETPPGGSVICSRFVPGNTVICTPRYTLSRLESCFESPNDFVPERWYSRPEMVKNKNAFAPFSLGRFDCVGKNLALAELRFVTALLAKKYDISFAEGEDGKAVEGNLKDQFTAVPGRLRLVLRERKSSWESCGRVV
ncbi:MAG: hypothetical protein Q9175_004399 [Cornicularia normoerica]